MRLLSPLLSIGRSAPGCRSIAAVQNGWSGAGSNRRPSAFQGQRQAQFRGLITPRRAPRVPHQCLTTIDLGRRDASPCAARSDSARAISASRPSTVWR